MADNRIQVSSQYNLLQSKYSSAVRARGHPGEKSWIRLYVYLSLDADEIDVPLKIYIGQNGQRCFTIMEINAHFLQHFLCSDRRIVSLGLPHSTPKSRLIKG